MPCDHTPISGIRLSTDGTDVTAAGNGDYESEDDSRSVCGARRHEGNGQNLYPGSRPPPPHRA